MMQDDTGYEGSFGDFVGTELGGKIDAFLEQTMQDELQPEEVHCYSGVLAFSYVYNATMNMLRCCYRNAR